MAPIFIYFIKSGALIVLFLAAYYIFLHKETFFKANRWFLLTGLVGSLILPLITFKKTIWIDPLPTVKAATNWTPISNPAMAPIGEGKSFEIDWILVLITVYGIGILMLLAKFAMDFYALRKVLKGKKIYQQEDYKFVNVNENIAPFSYFNYIVYNPELYNPIETENILEHEKIHCSQNHTIDVLIARIFCIAFWWNPFIWLYKKAIVQNLEFIADSDAFKNISDKKAYQFTLLKITTHDSCVAISNHFYQSLIKKRIVMLNKNQSKRWNSWKYAIIVPALALFMWQFQVKVIAQEKQAKVVLENPAVDRIVQEVKANTTDAELKKASLLFKQEFGATLEFSKVKRNNKGEIIAIKATIQKKDGSKNSKSVYQVSGDEPIKAFKVFIDEDENGKELAGFGELNNMRTVYQTKTPSGVAVRVDADEIITQSYAGSDIEAPEVPDTPAHPTAPTPPTPPTPPNYPSPPSPPNFPTPPIPPTAPMNDENRKAWLDFEKQMEKYKTEMNGEIMQKYKAEMKEYAKQMASMEFDATSFKEEMKEFQKEMKAYQKELMTFNKEIQKEREQARKLRAEELEEARREREKQRP